MRSAFSFPKVCHLRKNLSSSVAVDDASCTKWTCRGNLSVSVVCLSFLIYVIYLHMHIAQMENLLDWENQQNCSDPLKPSPRFLRIYKTQALMRKAMLLSIDSDEEKFTNIYNNMVPEAISFASSEIISSFRFIAQRNSKLVPLATEENGCAAHLRNLPKDCVIFSLGMNNDITFEEHLQKISRQKCRLFAFDTEKQEPSTLKELKKIRATATVAKISKRTDNDEGEYTLEDLMKMHRVKRIDVLKMDIEGGELAVMEEFLKRNVVSQIMVEVHGTPFESVQFLRLMGENDYLLFHFEINGAWPKLCEYAFIHKSFLERYRAIEIARFLN